MLLPDEAIVHHWPAPRGRGLLTNLRIVIVTHPHPVHRSLQWDVGLERIEALEVEPLRSRRHPERGIAEPFGHGPALAGGFDPWYGVEVNGRAVYVGDPNPCADLQERIDEARTSRCMAVYGRMLPYRPGERSLEDQRPFEDEAATVAQPMPPPERGSAGSFLLFIAGETYLEMINNSENTVGGLSLLRAGSGLSQKAGLSGHERADSLPGQTYGPQAAIGRMVLDIARQRGISIHVVDVDHSGTDVGLVQQFVSADDELPILIRPDGTRLTGDGSFVPAHVSKFLDGR